MLHLATIIHDRIHYILLPFADHFDVNIFLRCGMSDDVKQVYDFRQKFPYVAEISDPLSSLVTRDLLRQCNALTDALRWLHEGMYVSESPDSLFCAHMDLKPANILIVGPTSEELRVGRWKISDFGISVFRKQEKDQETKYGTSLDYYTQVTMNTRPKRAEGPYTAPEVCQNQNQRGVGRRSDVWSFGCFFSEVYLFALGRAELVNEFRMIRKQNTGTDYFYMQTRMPSLGATRTARYEIRPWILNYLSAIPDKYAGNKNRWGTCCVQSIYKMLNPDPERRPPSRDLRSLTWHVTQHFGLSPDDLGCDCTILSSGTPKLGSPLPTPEGPSPPLIAVKASSTPVPSSRTSSHTIPLRSDSQTLHSHSEPPTPPVLPSRPGSQALPDKSGSDGRVPSVYSSLHSQVDATDPLGISPLASAPTPSVVRSTTFGNEEIIHQGTHSRNASSRDIQSSRPSWTSQSSHSGSSINVEHRTFPMSDRQTLPNADRPPFSHGIQIPSHKALVLRTPAHWTLRVEKQGKRSREMMDISKKTINSIAMTPIGPRVACLTGSTIHLFALEPGARETHELHPPVELPNYKDHKWKQVALAGPFLGAWGLANGKKKVWIQQGCATKFQSFLILSLGIFQKH